MEQRIRYRKPNLTNLPPELGKAIFKQILSTPAPDRKARQREAERLEREIIKEREKEKKIGYFQDQTSAILCFSNPSTSIKKQEGISPCSRFLLMQGPQPLLWLLG